jgi:hypothetical protein
MEFLTWYSSLSSTAMFFLGVGAIIVIGIISQLLIKVVAHITIAFGARKVGHWPEGYIKRTEDDSDDE